MYRTSDYHFDLPPELIAQHPADQRDRSRLLVVNRATGTLDDRVFADVGSLVARGDALVLNETRVFPARLKGRRAGGGAAEVFLLHPSGHGEDLWMALVKPGARLRPGRVVEISPELSVSIEDTLPDGERLVRLSSPLGVDRALERYGEVPLPPYVRRDAEEVDRERYQTVYARERGSVAAPTAGLHFTPELLKEMEARGVRVVKLVLHVGVGTFRPVEVEDPAEHIMHREWYRLGADEAATLNRVRVDGGAIWAVGTTTVRTLESSADEHGSIVAGEAWTDIFIRPPYRFRAVDRLITNFHLPRSTLLMLVSAFAGYELTMRAYRHAAEERYRFFSYGDAMALM
jgi:S-adenosylmethionine:tRNA ribosyltransferase-isomerase